MINTDRSKMLDSGFFENQVWGALHKAWKGYVIAKNKDEYEKMEHYARIIQELQHDSILVLVLTGTFTYHCEYHLLIMKGTIQ